MKLIVCLDDRGGMAFNRRRQSRDRVLCEDIVRTLGSAPLFMSEYSAPLFEGLAARIVEREDYLAAAGGADFCFCERESVSDHAERIDTVIVYRWNRRYPGDVFLDLPLDVPPWRRISSEQFAGSSHETITKEVYVK